MCLGLLVGVTLASALVASAPIAAARRSARCLPTSKRSWIVRRNASAVVWYGKDGTLYGCLWRVGRRLPIGFVQPPDNIVAHVQLAGDFVAYELDSTGSSSAAGWLIETYNLRTRESVLEEPTGPAEYDTGARGDGPVTALVLDSHGDIAWINTNGVETVAADLVTGPPITTPQPRPLYELWKVVGTGTPETRLDSGPGIDPVSLRLIGNTLTWKNKGTTRTNLLR
jgi:hypothetical protein